MNLRVFDANGTQVQQVSVWIPQADSVYLLAAVMGENQTVIISGTAVKNDGARTYFVGSVDPSGKLGNVIQTNPFLAHQICVASDGRVWTFGDVERSLDDAVAAGDLLREFDLKQGQLASFVAAKSFPGPAATFGGPRREVFLGCAQDRVVAYSGPVDAFWQLDKASGYIRQFKIDRSASNLPVHGFAVSPGGDLFAALGDYTTKDGIQGLFELQVSNANGGIATWLPVSGATGLRGQPGLVNRVWGFDGDLLVHGVTDSPSGRSDVRWSRVQSKLADRTTSVQ